MLQWGFQHIINLSQLMYEAQVRNSLKNINNSIGDDATSQRVQLYLSARNLLDLDVFTKSDPYIRVYFKAAPHRPEKFIGRTETIDNNLNPNFKKTFSLDYIFEAHQELRFEVYDEDEGQNDQLIGAVKTSLGAVAGARSQTLLLNLQNPNSTKQPGKLVVRLEPYEDSNILLTMKWSARKLLNTDSWFDFWDKSDPYLLFHKIRSDNTLIEAGRTEVIMDNLAPSWNPVFIEKKRIIADDNTRGKFKIECWDWEEAGESKHQFIGETYVEMAKIKETLKFPIQFQMTNPKHKKPGILILEWVKEVYKPTFLQFIRGGLELNLSIAIDFTGSNGIPTVPSSLHYMNNIKLNQYQEAILGVGKILLNYDTDQRIPCFGFGAKPGQSKTVSHCFPLSLNPEQLEAFGLEHLMSMYANTLRNVEFSGPTYFEPILSEVVKIARRNQAEGSNTYQIFLILTDGEIHDMDKTINVLIEACLLPLSIIIVGVGGADFTNMERLDGDEGLYNSNGQRAKRDIVQFVPFREVGLNGDMLAKQLLAELPVQVTSYMNMIGKLPNPLEQLQLDNLFMSDKVIKQGPQNGQNPADSNQSPHNMV